MATKKTRLSMRENSRAVGIPREFQLDGDKIDIQPLGNTPVFHPQKLSWTPLMDSPKKFSEDFMAQGRLQPALHKRKRPFA
jgi:antitoxin VapB